MKIYNACLRGGLERSIDDEPPGAAGRAVLLPVIDPYNPIGSSGSVDMQTARDLLWKHADDRCHVNLVACDSDWEAASARP